jgi:hypothetical protein
MTNTNIITSNGVNLTIDDLKQAIKLTDIDWNMAAYANPKANSKDPTDICQFDFFDKDAWDTMDKDFAEEYVDCDEDKVLAIARIIEKRSSIWQDWAEQIRIHEEDLHILTGRPFSFAYAKLFIETDNFGGINPALSQADWLNDYTIIHNEQEKRDEYRSEFVWGEVKYLVTKFYSHERLKQGNTEDQPDSCTIKVEKADD